MRCESWFRSAAFTLALVAPGAIAQTPATAPASPETAAPAADAKARMLQSAAAAYGEYQGEVTAIRAAPLSGASQLDKALSTFGGQNTDQLSSGWIAYSALIASQNKDFAEAVRDIDGFYGRDRVMTGMRNDVGYARTLEGGEEALQTALTVNSQDATRISSAAAFVKDQAYKLQNIAWGKSRFKDPTGVANKLKLSAKTARPIADSAQKVFAAPDINTMLASAAKSPSNGSAWDKLSMITASAPAAALTAIAPAQTSQSARMKVQPKFEGTANRIVTLAAFHVLEAEKSHQETVQTAMKDRQMYECIDWAQLQLQACVSAAYTRADMSFCLAQHALGMQASDNNTPSVGACFNNVAR
jgi:hypothetical protein